MHPRRNTVLHAELAAARQVVEVLPPDQVGRCVLGLDGSLFRGDIAELRAALDEDRLVFHRGSIRGALPTLKSGD